MLYVYYYRVHRRKQRRVREYLQNLGVIDIKFISECEEDVGFIVGLIDEMPTATRECLVVTPTQRH